MPESATSGLDVSVIRTHAVLVAFGGTVIGPLKSVPQIEGDTNTYPLNIYENGEEVLAEYLNKNNANVTIETDNIDYAIAQIESFKVGENLCGSERVKPLTLTPIDGGDGAKTLTFTDAYLQPGLSYVPNKGSEHTAKLVFRCVPNVATKKLFTFV